MGQAHYKNVNENPCNMCMPMGGIIPFKGLEHSMVLLHGSQGCATYMRRHIAEHFNEPIDVGSTSLNEKGTIYGGENNLKQGLDNIIRLYRPKIIGVLTTCLAETIGEDIDRMTADYLRERAIDDVSIVTVPTPGYGDSHAEGYWLALRRIVEQSVRVTEKHGKVNIVAPHISPADIREIKRILELMQVAYTLLPDITDTLDRPFARPYKKIPDGGTKLADIAQMPGAWATIQFGSTVDDRMSPGRYLEKEFGVPLLNLPLPIGIENTDLFINALREITGRSLPEVLAKERGRLLDCMIDAHKYNFAGRSVIFGDPELVYAMSKTCIENGVFPVVAATGSRTARLSELLKPELERQGREAYILSAADFTTIQEKSREMQANIAIGHSDGRFLTEHEGIPLVRMGFPIHDRLGGQRILSAGYAGTALFIDRLTNTLLENKLTNYRSNMYLQYYRGQEMEPVASG